MVAADDEKAGIGLKPYNRLQQVKLDVKLDVIQHAQEEQQRIELRLELLDLIDSVRSEELHEVEREREEEAMGSIQHQKLLKGAGTECSEQSGSLALSLLSQMRFKWSDFN